MGRSVVMVSIVIVILQAVGAGTCLAVVLDFEGLPIETVLTGTAYAGLTWEHGNTGIKGNQGYWLVTKWGGTLIPAWSLR
ncbi:MAG: hypothetical protein Q7T82_00075 [Armatimonadota bacterium]|nr:hypothetical protein [Armatimonadota bacterium]